MKKPLSHYVQLDSMDCSLTCLRMILKHSTGKYYKEIRSKISIYCQ